MDKNKVLDYGATMVGGGVGIEQVYEALDMLSNSGPSWMFAAALIKGLMLLVFGYFSFKQRSSFTPPSP